MSHPTMAGLFLFCLVVTSTVNAKYSPPKVEQQVEQTSIPVEEASSSQNEAALLSVKRPNPQSQVSSFQSSQSTQQFASPSAASVFAQLEQKYPQLKWNSNAFQSSGNSQGSSHSGPINVAINQVSRTVEYRPEGPRAPPAKPSLLEVGPNTNSELSLLFKSRSSTLFDTNTRHPYAARPDTSVYFSSHAEPPLQLVQTVHKPIVREYTEFMRPVSYTTSVIRPVQETVRTVVHTSQSGLHNNDAGRQRQAQYQTGSQAQYQAFQPQTVQPAQAQTFFSRSQTVNSAQQPFGGQQFFSKVQSNGKSSFERAQEILGNGNFGGSQGYSQVQVASKPLVFNTQKSVYQQPAQSSYSYSSSSSSSSSSSNQGGHQSFSPSIQQVISKFNSAPQQQTSYSSVQVKPSVAHVIQSPRPVVNPVTNIELEVSRPVVSSVNQRVDQVQEVQSVVPTSVQSSTHVQQERIQIPVQTTQVNQFEKITVPVETRYVQNFSPLPFAVPQFNVQPVAQFPFVQQQFAQSQYVQPQFVQNYQQQQVVPTFQTIRTVQVRPLVTETNIVTAHPYTTTRSEQQIFKQAQSVRPASVARFVESPTIIGVSHQPQNIQTLSQNQNSYLLRNAQEQQQQQVQQVQPLQVNQVAAQSQPATAVTFESSVPTVNFQTVQPQPLQTVNFQAVQPQPLQTVNFQAVQPQPFTTVNRQVKYSTTDESSEESSEESSSSVRSSGSVAVPAPFPVAPAPAPIPLAPAPAPAVVETGVSENSVEGSEDSVESSNSENQSSVEYAQPAGQPVPVASTSTSSESSSSDLTSDENESSSSSVATYGSNLVQQPSLQLDQTQQAQEDEVDSSKKK